MTVPLTSTFPDTFDDDSNLFLVHDGLRLYLVEDYNPGDTQIFVGGDIMLLSRMPPTGLITLTEQCSDIDKRALSFYYTLIDTSSGIISGLTLLDGFEDVVKPKNITNVTQNVMAEHHNNIKEAVVAIQEFAGVKGTIDDMPFGETLEGRINFLRKVVLVPRAWFSVNKRIGNAPLEVTFTDRSFRLGTDGTAGPIILTWDFGDHTSSTISYLSTISATDEAPDDNVDVLVRDTDRGTIKKTYYQPGIYTVTMRVENDFGEDEFIFNNAIIVRAKAPDEAIINFVANTALQLSTSGVPPDGPFETPPTIRSPINTLIQIEVQAGENPATPGHTYGGEHLDSEGHIIDPIANWSWALGDDLLHANASYTKASYGVGGIYDFKLRVDTELGAYRITTYENCIDIVENTNLWLWVFQDSVSVRSYEYGLISETFKLTDVDTATVIRNDDFLSDAPEDTLAQQMHEFRRNTGFAPRSTTTSGKRGAALLYWASGRDSDQEPDTETINVLEFNGFATTYTDQSALARPWNWCHVNSPNASFFFGGRTTSTTVLPRTSPVNTNVLELNLTTLAQTITSMTSTSYINGAQEVENNVAVYSEDEGESVYGHFSIYRTAWKDNTGYIARNAGIGPFLRIASFYRTQGSTAAPFQYLEKLQDIQGPTKLEGELVSLSQGVYFFNNSGSISAFDPVATIWRIGGSGVNSMAYRSLQDTSVEGFDEPSNTLLAASDGDKRAYLSFDYSTAGFIKFNEIDTTFSALGIRPEGTQWILAVY